MKSAAGLVIGILLSLGLAALAGENPIHVFSILIKSSFGSRYDLGLTLFYATSLVFTGLSVAVAFRAGLFNIGAEGQLLVGALSATAFALSFPSCPYWLAPWAAGFCAILAGGIWGWIPGYLRARRGSHEVVVTMMMNFIAAGMTSYYALGIFKSLESQNPETQAVSESYMFKAYDFVGQFFLNSPANLSLLLAILVAVILHFVFQKTKWGFEVKMSGANEQAALYSGIDSTKIKVISMVLAGGLSGMVAFNEIMGSSGKFRIGFSPEYGFVGIAVALLAGNQPLAILVSAFLFGALQKGASDLDMETAHITRDFARILQAIIIFSVIAMQYKGKRNGRSS